MHFLGRAYPSNPGLMAILVCTTLQERHCIAIFVALDLIPEAETTIPGIFISFDTMSGYKDIKYFI